MKTYVWKDLNEEEKKAALRRPEMQADPSVAANVRKLLDDVQKGGAAAVRDIVKRFDGYDPDPLFVAEEEIERSAEAIPDSLRHAIDTAYANVRRFHEKQGARPFEIETTKGIMCSRLVVAYERVGLYVPGGTAPLISTALMLGVPAQIAGVKEIVFCTPAKDAGKINPAMLYVAFLCGAKRFLRFGGVGAIGALAYGCEGLGRVEKIFGPGNLYVTEAKQQVSKEPGGPAIDMPAGPSEVLVVRDSTTNPVFAAADLLAQSEHDKASQVVLIAESLAQIKAVEAEVEKQKKTLSRREICEACLTSARAFVAQDKKEAMEISNLYAPEHLILSFEGARDLLPLVQNAASVFCGPFTPESLGDYASGTNHVLPTYGAARSFAGLSVEAFQKTITVQEASWEGLKGLGEAVMTFAQAEGLDAHARAVSLRLEAGAGR